MIKKLRVKFIAVIMVIVTLMLLVVFGFVLRSAQSSFDKEALETLQEYGKDPGRPGHKPGRHMPVFVLEIDPEGKLIASGGEYFDLSEEEMREIYQAALEDGKKTGMLMPWELRYHRNDGLGQVSYVFMDISAQKHMMDDLITTCCLVFAAAMCVFFLISLWLSKWIVRPVEEAWDKQRQFVADASHELKTPLTVILTNAEMLQSEEYDDAAKKRFSGSILSMSRQMRGLVEGLLDLARVDSGKVREQLAPVELSGLAEECVLGFEPVYFEAGRELRSVIEPGIRVKGSESHLRQVIDILLDNGCKYGAPGQTVSLTLKQSRGKCLLTVHSLGEPLTKQQAKDIFKRFYRVDEARSMNRSYGLGLPIAQSIVTAHQGKIWATGTEQGNTFCVQLPTL